MQILAVQVAPLLIYACSISKSSGVSLFSQSIKEKCLTGNCTCTHLDHSASVPDVSNSAHFPPQHHSLFLKRPPPPPFCYLSQPETLFIELLTPELSVALAQNALHLCYFPKLNIVRGKSPERHKIFEDVKASEPSVGFPGSYNHSAAEEKLLE